jgi:hypothetical protein
MWYEIGVTFWSCKNEINAATHNKSFPQPNRPMHMSQAAWAVRRDTRGPKHHIAQPARCTGPPWFGCSPTSQASQNGFGPWLKKNPSSIELDDATDAHRRPPQIDSSERSPAFAWPHRPRWAPPQSCAPPGHGSMPKTDKPNLDLLVLHIHVVPKRCWMSVNKNVKEAQFDRITTCSHLSNWWQT